jgi:hypothetical protein
LISNRKKIDNQVYHDTKNINNYEIIDSNIKNISNNEIIDKQECIENINNNAGIGNQINHNIENINDK